MAGARSRDKVAVEVCCGFGEHADCSGSKNNEEVGLHCGLEWGAEGYGL